jgi:hypothetical protein
MIDAQDEKFNFWWDEKEGIVRANIIGYVDEQQAKKIVETGTEIIKSRPEKPLMLFDLTASGSASSLARKIIADGLKPEIYSKTAFFGTSIFNRVLVSFIVFAAGSTEYQVFF